MACIDCKFYVPSSTRPVVEQGVGFLSFSSEPVPKHCSKGFDDIFALWWKNNGMKPGAEARLDVPECFEQTAIADVFDSLFTNIDRITKLLES